MEATIIRTQEAVAGAPMADLVATYQALTGKVVKKFESRTFAERANWAYQQADAMLVERSKQ